MESRITNYPWEDLVKAVDNIFDPGKINSLGARQCWKELIKDDRVWEKLLEVKVKEHQARIKS